MSTRSGKRIHISFNENTVKSETDFTRSERKTRSKHVKENFDELSGSSIKVKKRNYVAYPADDVGVDTVDSKNEEKTTRTLRKNALKEHNITATDTLEPAGDIRKSVRSTRRTRKFDENSQDTPEDAPRDEAFTKADLTKSKKGKKKKKVEQEQVEVTTAMPKKKSKKKKGKRSSSNVVEDIEMAAPRGLDKSNVSNDSFHSAADSPRNCNTDFNTINTFEHNDTNKTEARQTRSSMKLDLTIENVTEKEPKKRKSSIKVKHDSSSKDALFEIENHDRDSSFNGELKKRKYSVKYDDTKDAKHSTVIESNMLRTSLKNSVSNIIETPTKINTTYEKDVPKAISSQKKKKKSMVDTNVNDDLKSTENIEGTSFEKELVTETEFTNKKRKSAINTSINVTEKASPLKSAGKDKRKSPEAIIVTNKEKKTIDSTFNITENSPFKASEIKLIMETKRNSSANTTYNKDSETDSESIKGSKKSIVDETFDITSSPFKSANEVSSPFKMTDENDKSKSINNTTYEKDSDADQNEQKSTNSLITTSDNTETKTSTTFETDSNENKKTSLIKQKRKSLLKLSMQNTSNTDINSTFDVQENKLNSTFDKCSKSSLISSDNSMITLDKSDASRISITSDESKTEENILNTTPVLIESSMDESQMNTTNTPPKHTSPQHTAPAPVTPLKREGTFTKDEPEVISSPSKTPTKRMSLPSPGFTPFHVNKSSTKEKSTLNVTRSIEKRRSSLAEPARTTRVMFCSPVNNPSVVTQNRRKVIKSNLKGSNKSFVFDESVSLEARPATRKRSYTQSDADDARVKRKRLADELQQSVDRLSRPRTSSASAKLAEPTTPSKKPTTPLKKSDAKLPRTKLPNFAALHQKHFAKMESLDECQERKAKRAKQLLTPTGAVNMLDRISPKDKVIDAEKPKEAPEKSKEAPNKPETPIKSLPTFKSLNPGYTRFGFKLNLDVNPFSIPSKSQPKPKENKPNGLTREPTLPSLAGATSVRREVAKQTVMREKSFTDRRSVKRTENRTVIKGVRTNRRFELQMQMRHI